MKKKSIFLELANGLNYDAFEMKLSKYGLWNVFKARIYSNNSIKTASQLPAKKIMLDNLGI